MKNQNDLIWSIVSLVLMLIVVGVCWGTMKMPQPIPPPAQVNIAQPTYPTSTVVKDNALPNAGSGDQGGGGGRGGAPAGGGSSPASALPGGSTPGGNPNLHNAAPGGL